MNAWRLSERREGGPALLFPHHPQAVSVSLGGEEGREPLEQSGVAFGCYGTENAEKMVGWQYGEKAKADERRSLEATDSEIRMRRLDSVVEANDLLVKLGADAADEPVPKGRHPA